MVIDMRGVKLWLTHPQSICEPLPVRWLPCMPVLLVGITSAL